MSFSQLEGSMNYVLKQQKEDLAALLSDRSRDASDEAQTALHKRTNHLLLIAQGKIAKITAEIEKAKASFHVQESHLQTQHQQGLALQSQMQVQTELTFCEAALSEKTGSADLFLFTAGALSF